MPQAFGNVLQTHNGSTNAESVKLYLNSAEVAGFVMQTVQFQFQQQVTMLFEVGSSRVYYVGGRAQGTLNIGRIAGLGRVITQVIAQLGTVCAPKDVSLRSSGNCNTPGSTVPLIGGVSNAISNALNPSATNYTLKSVVINQIGGNITAQDIVFNEQVGAMFLDMNVT